MGLALEGYLVLRAPALWHLLVQGDWIKMTLSGDPAPPLPQVTPRRPRRWPCRTRCQGCPCLTRRSWCPASQKGWPQTCSWTWRRCCPAHTWTKTACSPGYSRPPVGAVVKAFCRRNLSWSCRTKPQSVEPQCCFLLVLHIKALSF